MKFLLQILALLMLVVPQAWSQAGDSGQVQIPVETYNQLIETSKDPKVRAPAAYALGTANVVATVRSIDGILSTEVTAELNIRVLEDQWSLIPLLPPGVVPITMEMDGREVEMVPTQQGLAWLSKRAGSYRFVCRYNVDVGGTGITRSLQLPLPLASSTKLSATIPGEGLNVSVLPSTDQSLITGPGLTKVLAHIPKGLGVQLAWQNTSGTSYAISRAQYGGEIQGEAFQMEGSLDLELFNNDPLLLPLLPTATTLLGVQVDGKDAPISLRGGDFVARVQGKGNHTILMSFQVPVNRSSGPPKVELSIPAIPVSRFDITLPGQKSLTVSPATQVKATPKGASTISTFYVPLTQKVSFTWQEAIPEDVQTELRANASIYHLAQAEEGVLTVRAMVLYEITRGKTSSLDFEVPPGAQINTLSSTSGGVSDWRTSEGKAGENNTVTVFLDREIEGEYALEIVYEQILSKKEGQVSPVNLPLLWAKKASRQRGMVALLSNKEFALKPVEETQVSKVGENQLPAFVRQSANMTVAHTYKYSEQGAALLVQATLPERKQGRFNAQVDTLISIGEVTMKGAATVEVNVKSGSIMSLALSLPADLNVLSLSAPSLRTYEVGAPKAGSQGIDVQFTQELEGQFRVEVQYERIMAEGAATADVPTLTVSGAEVEQGRVAVEALTAVEVQSAEVDAMSSLDIGSLPQSMILKTTNPILLAYKYIRSELPATLTLKITRHRVIDVQDAVIDHARYITRYTDDGVAVTVAQFQVRNSRKQFLKVNLPPGSEVWNAYVEGESVKPALAEAEDGSSEVLIKIISSTKVFIVDLLYRTPTEPTGSWGSISGRLPHPEMVVTTSFWEVYLPAGLSYGEPKGNMTTLSHGEDVDGLLITQRVVHTLEPRGTRSDLGQIIGASQGVRFQFEKAYANQSEDEAYFSVSYASKEGTQLAEILAAIASLLIWLGVLARLGYPPQLSFLSRQAATVLVIVGVAAVGLCYALFDLEGNMAVLVSGVLFAAIAAIWGWERRKASREAEKEVFERLKNAPAVPSPEEEQPTVEDGGEADRGDVMVPEKENVTEGTREVETGLEPDSNAMQDALAKVTNTGGGPQHSGTADDENNEVE